MLNYFFTKVIRTGRVKARRRRRRPRGARYIVFLAADCTAAVLKRVRERKDNGGDNAVEAIAVLCTAFRTYIGKRIVL